MSQLERNEADGTVVRDAEAMASVLQDIASQIVKANPEIESLALLGILSRGRPLADKLAAIINEMTGKMPKIGSLATTLYRDDLRSSMRYMVGGTGETQFDFNVDSLNIIIVDDVIAAGRTTRAALDEVMDYGRPKSVQLVCLVDRGNRELPIQPDYLGWKLSVSPDEYISVRVDAIDNEDAVVVEKISKTCAGTEE